MDREQLHKELDVMLDEAAKNLKGEYEDMFLTFLCRRGELVHASVLGDEMGRPSMLAIQLLLIKRLVGNLDGDGMREFLNLLKAMGGDVECVASPDTQTPKWN